MASDTTMAGIRIQEVVYMTVQRYRHEKKMMPCRECGICMEVGIRTKKAPRHVECGVRVAAQQQFQMARKSGPWYEKWLANPGGRNGKALGTTPVVRSTTGPDTRL